MTLTWLGDLSRKSDLGVYFPFNWGGTFNFVSIMFHFKVIFAIAKFCGNTIDIQLNDQLIRPSNGMVIHPLVHKPLKGWWISFERTVSHSIKKGCLSVPKFTLGRVNWGTNHPFTFSSIFGCWSFMGKNSFLGKNSKSHGFYFRKS